MASEDRAHFLSVLAADLSYAFADYGSELIDDVISVVLESAAGAVHDESKLLRSINPVAATNSACTYLNCTGARVRIAMRSGQYVQEGQLAQNTPAK